MRIRTMAAFAAGVMVAAAGTAFATTKVAAIVGPDNQIHGCYLTSAGLLRVVAAGTPCRDGESAIAWSATGSGAPGPAGPKGDPGTNWRGSWVSGAAYKAGDIVRYGDGTWIVKSGFACALANTNCRNTVPPGTNPTWQRFVRDGSEGPAGPAGSSSSSLLQTVTVFGARSARMAFVGPVRSAASTASCPSGYVVTGGGFQLTNSSPLSPYPEIDSSYAAGATSWRVEATAANLISTGFVRAHATCARL